MKTSDYPNDDEDISCPYQAIGMGDLICRAADISSNGATNKTNPKMCLECPAGKIYREVGCDLYSPETLILRYVGGSSLSHVKVLCKKRKRETTLEYCQKCTLVTAATTKEIVSNAKDLFQAGEYYSAYKDLEKARKCLRDDDYHGSITSSISFLESTMKMSLEKIGEELPNSLDVTGLWKALRSPLLLDEIDPSGCSEKLIGTLSGAVSHLGGVRNNLSDSHGRGSEYPDVSFSIAELAINSSATVATFVVRRTNQILEK